MKKFLIFLLVIGVLALGSIIYMQSQGHDFDSIINTPETTNINISCPDPDNALMTTVSVQNRSNREFSTVRYKIVYYNRRGEKAGEKTGQFLRTLVANGNMTKVVTLPLKASTCDCIITEAN